MSGASNASGNGSWRIIEDERVYDAYWPVRRVILEAVDGAAGNRLVREIVEARRASAVLLHDPVRDTVLLIRQFRPAVFVAHGDEVLLEVCAGIAEPGETPTACAIRETLEEAGVAIEAPRSVGAMYPSPGVCTEVIDLFIATYSPATRLHGGGGLAHEEEFTEPVEFSLRGALAAIEDGGIRDGKTIMLLHRLALERATAP